jgi:hypothetical protein
VIALGLATPGLAQDVVKPAAPPTVAVPVAVAAPAAALAPAATTAKSEIKVIATKPDPNDPDTVVCKRESDTGSRIKSTKVCASRRQWAAMGREITKQIRDTANVSSPN